VTLKERLVRDMKEALKDRAEGKKRLSVIRLTLSEIKNREIELRKELNNEEVVEVLSKEVKKRRDVIHEYEKAGRPDKVRELEEEIAILSSYLPPQLSEEEIEKIARETIKQVKAVGKTDMGKVMGAIMPKVKGRAEGKVVNEVVKRLLE